MDFHNQITLSDGNQPLFEGLLGSGRGIGMDTGYYIQDGEIFGPKGNTRSWVEGNYIYSSHGGYTQCWIEDDGRIFSSRVGNTEFFVRDDRIFGPSRRLPWLGR